MPAVDGLAPELIGRDKEGGHEADRSRGAVVQLAAGRVNVCLGAAVAGSVHELELIAKVDEVEGVLSVQLVLVGTAAVRPTDARDAAVDCLSAVDEFNGLLAEEEGNVTQQDRSSILPVAVEPVRDGEAFVVGRPEVLSTVDVVSADGDAKRDGPGEGCAAGGHLCLQRDMGAGLCLHRSY